MAPLWFVFCYHLLLNKGVMMMIVLVILMMMVMMSQLLFFTSLSLTFLPTLPTDPVLFCLSSPMAMITKFTVLIRGKLFGFIFSYFLMKMLTDLSEWDPLRWWRWWKRHSHRKQRLLSIHLSSCLGPKILGNVALSRRLDKQNCFHSNDKLWSHNTCKRSRWYRIEIKCVRRKWFWYFYTAISSHFCFTKMHLMIQKWWKLILKFRNLTKLWKLISAPLPHPRDTHTTPCIKCTMCIAHVLQWRPLKSKSTIQSMTA